MESFSVATTITRSTAIGDAYTAPSSLIDLMTFSDPRTSGVDGDKPLCAASPWYIGQSDGVPAVPTSDVVKVCVGITVAGAAVEVGGVDRVEGDGAGLADPPHAAAARASTTNHAPKRRLPLRSRCATRLWAQRRHRSTGASSVRWQESRWMAPQYAQ